MEIKTLIFLLLTLTACSDKHHRISSTTINPDSLPMQEFFENTKLTLTEKNRKLWTLCTSHIVKYRKDGSTYIQPVDIIYFTEGGHSRLKADSGRISSEMDTLISSGNVIISTYDKKEVTTSYIAWYKKSDKVTSDRFVKMITSEGDVYTGTGFIANTSLSEWKILKNVKARIHNIDNGINK
jgi:LPS export ABC transporter protein LptC